MVEISTRIPKEVICYNYLQPPRGERRRLVADPITENKRVKLLVKSPIGFKQAKDTFLGTPGYS